MRRLRGSQWAFYQGVQPRTPANPRKEDRQQWYLGPGDGRLRAGNPAVGLWIVPPVVTQPLPVVIP